MAFETESVIFIFILSIILNGRENQWLRRISLLHIQLSRNKM